MQDFDFLTWSATLGVAIFSVFQLTLSTVLRLLDLPSFSARIFALLLWYFMFAEFFSSSIKASAKMESASLFRPSWAGYSLKSYSIVEFATMGQGSIDLTSLSTSASTRRPRGHSRQAGRTLASKAILTVSVTEFFILTTNN